MWAWAAVIAGLCGMALAGVLGIRRLRRRLFVVTVEGASMEPTLVAGDRVLARRASGTALRHGQIVIIEQPARREGWAWGGTRVGRIEDGWWMIKRVVAIAGDVVPADVAGTVATSIDGRVPAGSIVVLGDNRDASIDSRELGFIPGGRVLGVALRWADRFARPQRRQGGGPACHREVEREESRSSTSLTKRRDLVADDGEIQRRGQ